MTAAASAKQPKIKDDVWASINGDEFLTEKGIAVRKRTREFMNKLEP